ncbi:MAG: Uma2 family endonuclease [Chloroflexi bacterium]|nr:Uma2 family endonuclease [Chloroflexota bacterium]
MVLEKQFINADMFLDYVEQIDDRIVELVEGVIVDMSRPGWEHGEILITLGALIRDHARKYDLGRVAGGDTGFVLERRTDGKDTVRGLDIAFVSKEKPQERLARGWTTIAPDLAVEIISPSNKAGDIEKKIEQLLDAGAFLIWVVYPELRTVKVHTTQGAKTLREDDTLTGGAVLPGFELRVGDIFPP